MPAAGTSPRVEIRPLLRRRSVVLGVAGCMISGVVLGTIYCLMPLFLKHQGMSHSSVGYWMALLIAAAILGQWPMGRLSDRYGRAFVMKCQSLLVIAAWRRPDGQGRIDGPLPGRPRAWRVFPCIPSPWPGDAKKPPATSW